jgi:hypothetical protein
MHTFIYTHKQLILFLLSIYGISNEHLEPDMTVVVEKAEMRRQKWNAAAEKRQQELKKLNLPLVCVIITVICSFLKTFDISKD